MTRRRVLVVDDDDTIRELLELTLGDAGYEVGSAAEGGAALELVERLKPHLILLDLRMPGVDGRGFAAAYRARPGRHAPIAVVTAMRDPARAATAIGAQGFVAKPFDLGELLNLVARLARG
jgi:CheY-like chemotaxis protein